MGRLTKFKFFTLAQILVTVSWTHFAFAQNNLFGGVNPTNIETAKKTCSDKLFVKENYGGDYDRCFRSQSGQATSNADDSSKKQCADKYEAYKNAKKDMQKACANSKVMKGSGNCEEATSDCVEKAADADLDDTTTGLTQTIDQIASISGYNIGASSINAGKTCPTMNYKDWASENKQLKDALKADKKELQDIIDQRPKITDKYNKENRDINKDFQDLKAKKAQDDLEQKDKARKAVADQQKRVQDAQMAFSNAQVTLVNIQQQMAKDYIRKNQAIMIAASALPAAQLECGVDYDKLMANLKKSSGSNGNVQGRAGKTGSALANYRLCVQGKIAEKQAAVKDANSQIEKDQIGLTAAEEAVRQAQLSMNTLNQQYQEQVTDQATANANAADQYQNQVAALTQRLTDNYNQSQQELNNLYTKQQQAQTQVNQDDVELKSNIAEKPHSGATGSYDDVVAEWRNVKLQLDNAIMVCNCKTDKSNPGTDMDSKYCPLLNEAAKSSDNEPAGGAK